MLMRLIRHPSLWGIAAALVVVAPQLRHANFNTDDYHQLAVLEGIEIHRGMGPFSLYSFMIEDQDLLNRRIATGPATWYSDTSVTIDFFRPLSSAAMAINHEVSGLEPLGYALHSLGWYLLLIAAFGVLAVRIFPAPGGGWHHPVTYVAVLMFALSSANCSTVMWSAARWLLICTTFGIIGIIAFLRWREDGWRPGGVLSVAAFGAALLSGEAALAVMAFVVAHQLVGSSEPSRARLASLLPTASLAVLYLVFYKATSHGSTGLDAYVDPVETPLAFLVAVPSKVAAMLGELLLGTQSSLWYFPERRPATVLAGVVAIALISALLQPCWKRSGFGDRRRILWLAAGVLGSLVPLAARMPNPHVLIIPQIGTTLLVSVALVCWWRHLRLERAVVACVGGAACLVFVITLLVRPPFAWWAFGQRWQESHDRVADFHSTSVLNELLPHQTAVFLNFTDWDLEFHGYYYRKVFGLTMPRAWWLLSSSPAEHRYHRKTLRTLEMEIVGGAIAVDTSRWQNGDVRELPGLTVTVLHGDRVGISKARFEFDRPLEHESLRFLVWREGSLRFAEIPKVGGALVVNQRADG